MNLRKQLILYMDLRGITAAELARRSGVSKQVLSLWLTGSSPRKLEQIKKVADTLETSIDDLVFGLGIDSRIKKAVELDALVGDGWITGLFEIQFRRIKK